MKILIDINHPAHVHYFRNFIKLMEEKGHRFCVINRDSKMINQLLDYYRIEHTIRNKRNSRKGTIPSLVNLLKMTLWCIRKSLSFHPDMYIGFASSACAISSKLFGKPSILIDDTEFNAMNHKLYLPCCSVVLNPFYFKKKFNEGGKKQIFFNAFVEQFYLHSTYFHNDAQVLSELNVGPKEYVIVRYSAYDAHHDLGVHPFSEEAKKRIIQQIAKHCRVFVSLEKTINDPFYDNYRLDISPEKMHDLEANAKFMVTEGITMASEAFILGVPYILINPLKCGYIEYQCKNYPDRAFHTTDETKINDIITKLLQTTRDTESAKAEIESITINPTSFLEWFVENYPDSKTKDYWPTQ